MSLNVQKQVWQSPRSFDGFTTLVLVRLADFANDEGGSIFPSVGTVAKECRLSPRTVRKVFRDLEGGGILIKVADEQPGRYRPREYRIDLSALQSDGTPVMGRGRHDVPGGTTDRAARQAIEGGKTCRRGRQDVPAERSINNQGNNQGGGGLFGDIVVIPLEPKKRTAKTKPEASDIDAEFIEWYAQTPRKEGPGAARSAYMKARKKAGAADLLAGIMRYAARVEAENTPRQYIKTPQNWLRDERWLDDASASHDEPRCPIGKPNVMDAAARVFSDDPAAAQFREMFK